MTDQRATIEWRDGTPVSTRFDDPYFSLQDGLEETRHVFLAGNGLPGRYSAGFRIAELGFGTGLNFLAALAAFRAAGCGGALSFTSFEAFPMSFEALQDALSHWPGLPRDVLVEAEGRVAPMIHGPDFTLRIIEGDARLTLPEWGGQADAWFLDGFSPAKNPELWGPDLMAEVYAHTAPGGTLATYSAAGHVRRSLEQAGFTVSRSPGFGRKRHMTQGVRDG